MEKIKNFEEYQELAVRTIVDLGGDEANMFHMNIGVVTEIGELLDPFKKSFAYGKEIDWVNVGEELADICWYIAGKNWIYTEKFTDKKEMEYVSQAIKQAIEKGKEIAERFQGEKKDKAAFVTFNLFAGEEGTLDTLISIYAYCTYADLDFWQLLTNNIEKLKVRYPEKFTQEKAVNRDLDSEREQIEK